MRSGWKFGIGLVVFSVLASMPARAGGPPPDFKRLEERGDTIKSPDKTLVIEQYTKDMGGYEGFTYQFWIFDKTRKNAFFLNRDEDKNLAGYPAGFRFSPNSQWLVRMQGTGAGFQTLLLYKRDGNRFVAATEKPLGDLAWEYFFTQSDSKGMPTEPDELNHKRADLLKGMEENYAWLGVKWPDSRYVVISLGFDIQGNDRPTPWIEGWRCVYDTQTGQFSVPAVFAEHNAKARMLPKPKTGRS